MIKRITTLVFVFLTIVGNAVWAYQISTPDELKAFRNLVNGGDADACAILTDDIELDSSKEWTPIGYANDNDLKYSYTGTFDGDGHTISGLSAPLFNIIGTSEMNWSTGTVFIKGGEVKNLVIKGNINITKGNSEAGGICIYNVGKITNCANEVSISSNNSFYVGGICAQNAGIIEKCYNSGAISTTNDYGVAGGISGKCIKNEDDTPSTIKNCYNCGSVTSQSAAAGICVYSNDGNGNLPSMTIENCHNYGELTDNENISIAGILLVLSQSAGFDPTGYITVTNCYYKDDIESGFHLHYYSSGQKSYDAVGVCEAKNETAFDNGEVLCYLQHGAEGNEEVWTQGEDFPVFVSEENPQLDAYRVTFDYNYEGSEPEYQFALENSNTTVNFPADPTREGYNFLGWSESEEGEVISTENVLITQDITYYAQWQKIETEEPEQPGDDDEEDQGNTGIHKPQRPIKYYNIYIDTICPGLNVEVSKDVVQEGHQVSAYLTIQSECDTTGMRFEYKRGLFDYWKDLKELEGVQPGEYIIKNIYTDIYIRALDATLPEEEPTGIDDLEGVKAYAKEGSIYVYTPSREEVTIISMSGAIIKHEEQVGLQSYSVSRGIYIVRIGEKVFKLKN